MTRKDFSLVAALLRHTGTDGQREAFADAFAEINPRFDRERFLRAAGYTFAT
jgi:hypothetical protein